MSCFYICLQIPHEKGQKLCTRLETRTEDDEHSLNKVKKEHIGLLKSSLFEQGVVIVVPVEVNFEIKVDELVITVADAVGEVLVLMDCWVDDDDCIELGLFEEASIDVVVIDFGLVEVEVVAKTEICEAD